MRPSLAILLLLLCTSVFGETVTGRYVSNPPTFMHHFFANKTYTGRANGKTAEGVWEQGDQICSPFNDANLKLYAGDGQCCLEVKTVGSHHVFSKILFTGNRRTSLYALCTHSVMKQSSSSVTTPDVN
ncbi:MAG TPA: hypothetical protein DD440_03100 [Porticoccaceae bacterium]|nr:hypothetical protein [Porticoccaceae bacterium]